MTKKKILFYTTFLTHGGGIEVVTVQYMKELLEMGYDVDLYVDYNMGDDNIREKEIDKRVKIKYLKSEKISKMIYSYRTMGKNNKLFNIPFYLLVIIFDYFIWRKEIKYIKEQEYNATITFFQFLPGYITKVKGPKHLIFLHGSVHKFFIGIRKYFKHIFFRKLRKFSYVCTVSDDMGKELLEYDRTLRDKQITIHNPIDFKEINTKSNDFSSLIDEEKKLIEEKYICSVGRLDESQKDFTTLIKGYAELIKEKSTEEKLYLIGNGPDEKKLKNLVKDLGMQDKILFLGRKKNPYIWMKNARFFVLSSKYEGFPNVLVEALSLGTPIVSSDCPTGPREIVEVQKETGKLFKVGDINELKNKMLEMLKRKEELLVPLFPKFEKEKLRSLLACEK